MKLYVITSKAYCSNLIGMVLFAESQEQAISMYLNDDNCECEEEDFLNIQKIAIPNEPQILLTSIACC